MKKFSFIKWFSKRRGKTRAFAMRRAAHLRLGQRGETLALQLLRELGLEFLTRNYAGDKGEIDLIATIDDLIVFVEVKTRRRIGAHGALEAVSPLKLARMHRVALAWLAHAGELSARYRFDVIGVHVAPGLEPAFAWLQDVAQ